MKKPILALALLTGALLLQGCAAVVVGGAAGTAKATGDRRTLGAQWDDQAIELKAANLLADNKPLSAASKAMLSAASQRAPATARETPSPAGASRVSRQPIPGGADPPWTVVHTDDVIPVHVHLVQHRHAHGHLHFR